MGRKYCKFQQKLIANIATEISWNYGWLLQIAFICITSYGSFENYYKLCQKLLQITAGITDCCVITNCVVTNLKKQF